MNPFLPEWWLPNARVLGFLLCSPLVDPWLLARWAGQSLALSGLVFLADYLAGAAVLCLLGRRMPRALAGAAALAIGSGLNGMTLFWLGMAGWLFPWAPAAVTAALGGAGAVVLWKRRALPGFRGPARPRPAALALAALVLLPAAMHLMDLMTPVSEFDSLLYHMTAARHYRETQSLAYYSGARYNSHPHLGDLMLLRTWSILGDDALAKLQNLEWALLLLLVVRYAARELGWRPGWIPGALFLVSSPCLMWVSKVEYADLPLCAYTGVAAALLFHTLRRRVDLVVPAGLALGFAASTKLQAHVLAACLWLSFVAAHLLRRRRPGATARAAIVLGMLTAACCASWWLRSWIHTGSPAYPLFVKGNQEIAETLERDAAHGFGRGLKDFARIPWHMFAGPPGRFADAFTFGPAGLLLAIAAGAALLRSRRAPPPEVLFLAAPGMLYLPFWVFTSQVMRYLLGLLPLAAILFLWLLARARLARCVPFAVTPVLAALALHAVVLTSTLVRRPVVPAATHAQRRQALAAILPYSYALAELNRHASAQEKVYLLFCEEQKYYVKGASWGDWYGEHNYRWAGQDTRSPHEMAERLRAAGYRWIVVARQRARGANAMYGWGAGEWDGIIPGYPTIYSDRSVAVYRLW
jgi:hypothetical protein